MVRERWNERKENGEENKKRRNGKEKEKWRKMEVVGDGKRGF